MLRNVALVSTLVENTVIAHAIQTSINHAFSMNSNILNCTVVVSLVILLISLLQEYQPRYLPT